MDKYFIITYTTAEVDDKDKGQLHVAPFVDAKDRLVIFDSHEEADSYGMDLIPVGHAVASINDLDEVLCIPAKVYDRRWFQS